MARVRGRKHRDLKSEINIVPLLDVLLVLLLIFMATAPIITQSVEVDLPDATDSKTVSSDVFRRGHERKCSRKGTAGEFGEW